MSSKKYLNYYEKKFINLNDGEILWMVYPNYK